MGSLLGAFDILKEGVKRVKLYSTLKSLKFDDKGAIGVGTLIIFIAMIIVAGVTASVIIQTMNSLQQQAMSTGAETIREVSSGLKVVQVTGYNDGTNITLLAIFVKTIAGSASVDLNYTYVTISNTYKQVILNFSSSCFSENLSEGLFNAINSSNLSASTYGILKIRDIDNSCNATNPIINDDDLVVLLVNTTYCFSGIGPRTYVSGRVVPEQGIPGVISFTTPSKFVGNVIELQT